MNHLPVNDEEDESDETAARRVVIPLTPAQLMLARRIEVHPGAVPYARPGHVRASHQRCRYCGDILLPSYVAAWRAETREPLDVPPLCWECIERGR